MPHVIIENQVQRIDDHFAIVVSHPSPDAVHLAIERCEAAGARFLRLHTSAGDPAVGQNPSGHAQRSDSNQYRIDVAFAPTAGTVAEASAPCSVAPGSEATGARLGSRLLAALPGRGFKANVTRHLDRTWSFEARSKPQTGRPISLRRCLDRPNRSVFVPTDNLYTWGFRLLFSTWSPNAPAHENLWVHPAGASIHLACRPTPDHTPAKKRVVYTLHVDGLYDSAADAPTHAPRPDAAALDDAVAAALSGHVRHWA